jgi:hypothetical protein
MPGKVLLLILGDGAWGHVDSVTLNDEGVRGLVFECAHCSNEREIVFHNAVGPVHHMKERPPSASQPNILRILGL